MADRVDPTQDAEAPHPPANARGPVVAGIAILALAFGGFGTWAAMVPLNSAAIAPSTVAVEGKHKTVQHLEGGIIEAILVQEGSRVEAGDVLVRMDDTQSLSMLERLQGRYRAAVALAARLTAERDGLDAVAFPDWLLAEIEADAEVAEALSGQRALYRARKESMTGREAILRQRIAQSEEEIAGLKAQTEAEGRHLALLGDEIKGLKKLVKVGHAGKPRLLELQREEAEVEGDLAEHRALIARAKQRIGEAELQILQMRTDRLNEVVAELRETQTAIYDLEDQLHAARDVLQRHSVRAPHRGVVTNLQHHSPGAVVTPGGAILDIVPDDERLLVEARIRPDDIDVVREGMVAQVRLTAYKLRNTPTVTGTLVYLSADAVTEPFTEISYYLARIELDAEQLGGLSGIELFPGMPAEVIIETGERTALQYMLSPVTSGIHRMFREQ